MPQQVTATATLRCTQGFAPSQLVVLPTRRSLSEKRPAATVMDFIPLQNILPFGLCRSPTNPAVITATAAALGVSTPAPCLPAVTVPWTPGAVNVRIGGQPALDHRSQCVCAWAGTISITVPGTTRHSIP